MYGTEASTDKSVTWWFTHSKEIGSAEKKKSTRPQTSKEIVNTSDSHLWVAQKKLYIITICNLVYLRWWWSSFWIGRSGSIAWPLRSPNLTALDFLCGGMWKTLCWKKLTWMTYDTESLQPLQQSRLTCFTIPRRKHSTTWMFVVLEMVLTLKPTKLCH